MRTSNWSVVWLATLMVLASSCSKDEGVAPTRKDVVIDVYVAGAENPEGIACAALYWKNGTAVRLPQIDPGSFNFATSIFVSGSNVYVSGYEGDNLSTAVYWKNGEVTALQTPEPAQAKAYDICVSGSDVYVAGEVQYVNHMGSVAVYWKNGSMVTLSTPNITEWDKLKATSIAVLNGDIYASGQWTHMESDALYWKNDNLKILPHLSGNTSDEANSLSVSGADVYVAGTESAGMTSVGVYWKNEKAVALPSASSNSMAEANDIFVFQNDVYIAGSESTGMNTNALYWKNSTQVLIPALSSSAWDTEACSIFLVDSDVYVAGFSYNGMVPGALYWKNGIAKSIADPSSDNLTCYIATAIYVNKIQK